MQNVSEKHDYIPQKCPEHFFTEKFDRAKKLNETFDKKRRINSSNNVNTEFCMYYGTYTSPIFVLTSMSNI